MGLSETPWGGKFESWCVIDSFNWGGFKNEVDLVKVVCVFEMGVDLNKNRLIHKNEMGWV